jgi:hypothetical protein
MMPDFSIKGPSGQVLSPAGIALIDKIVNCYLKGDLHEFLGKFANLSPSIPFQDPRVPPWDKGQKGT